MRKLVMTGLLLIALLLAGCGSTTPEEVSATDDAPAETQTETETAEVETTETELTEENQENTMRLLIGETEVPVTWEESTSVDALKDLCPLTIQMSMYGGFEQVGPIGQSIVSDDQQTSTDYGDIVLYSGNQIVVFYGTNSWAYTRLGHVELSQQEMRDLLANGDVTITFEIE